MRHRRLSYLLILGVIFSSLTWGGACSASKGVQANVPGAANSFDSSTYLVLVATDSVIQTTKSDLSVGAFPTSVMGNVKTALNGLIQAYNVCDIAYQSYHTAALAGQATAAQQAAVTTSLNNMQAATSALTSAKGVN